MDKDEAHACRVISFFVSVGLLLCICLPPAFSYVEYDQWAFSKNTLSNEVDTSTVYENGRYFWGWGYSPITFPKTFQFVRFTPEDDGDLIIFTDNGLELRVEASFQYRLRKEELAMLFSKFGNTYHDQIVSIGVNAIKNAVPQYSMYDLLERREVVTAGLYTKLQEELNEVHCDVLASKFQLRRIKYPEQVITKFLATANQEQVNNEQSFEMVASLIRMETELQSQIIDANTTRILDVAAAEADLIRNRAIHVSNNLLAVAEGEGYSELFGALNITDNVPLQKQFLQLHAIMEGESRPKLLFGLDSANMLLNT